MFQSWPSVCFEVVGPKVQGRRGSGKGSDLLE